MSETIHFDTHRFVKRMTESGMSEATAEALADEQMRLIQGELATRQNLAEMTGIFQVDIEKVDANLRAEIKKVDANLRVEIEKVRSDLIRWMAGMLIAQGGVIVALLRLLPA